MHSSIVGLDATRAEASMANVTLTISNNQITSDFVMARGTASCGPAASGDSTLTNLVINGQAITVTGDPNQTVALPNGTVIINQQLPSLSGTSGELSVIALHVTTIDTITHQVLADVMLAIADAQIDCQAGSGPAGKATTGPGGTGARTFRNRSVVEVSARRGPGAGRSPRAKGYPRPTGGRPWRPCKRSHRARPLSTSARPRTG